MVFDLLNINIEIFSVEDIGKLRVSLHQGTGGSHPGEGGPVHIHEGVRRGTWNQAPLKTYNKQTTTNTLFGCLTTSHHHHRIRFRGLTVINS